MESDTLMMIGVLGFSGAGLIYLLWSFYDNIHKQMRYLARTYFWKPAGSAKVTSVQPICAEIPYFYGTDTLFVAHHVRMRLLAFLSAGLLALGLWVTMDVIAAAPDLQPWALIQHAPVIALYGVLVLVMPVILYAAWRRGDFERGVYVALGEKSVYVRGIGSVGYERIAHYHLYQPLLLYTRIDLVLYPCSQQVMSQQQVGVFQQLDARCVTIRGVLLRVPAEQLISHLHERGLLPNTFG